MAEIKTILQSTYPSNKNKFLKKKENYFQIPYPVLVNYTHLKKIPSWDKMHEEKVSIPWFSMVIRGVPRRYINH